MTQQMLDEFERLVVDIRTKREALERFKNAVDVKSPILSGMPHGSGISDPTAAKAVEIEDLEARLEVQQAKYEAMKPEILAFVNAIDNDITRLTFRFRELYGYTWSEIADVLGGYNTTGSVRERYKNYLKQIGIFVPKKLGQ